MKIEKVSVASLRAYDRNARSHSKKQIRALSKSIETFGFCVPVLIGDDNQIIAGHARVAAAALLGMPSVPAIRLSHLSEEKKRAYILADNRLAEMASWNKEMLAGELKGLVDVGFDIEVVGFETAQVDLILDEALEISGDLTGPEDDVPALPDSPPITRPGDIWVLGEHRLTCGDARRDATYARLLKGEKAQFVISDPPYNVVIADISGLGRTQHREFAMASGEMTEAQFTAFLQVTMDLMAANSVNGSIHALFMDWRHAPEMLAAGRMVYTELKNICVWVKSNGGMGTFYRSAHEFVFMWKYGAAAHVNTFELGQHGRYRTNVWSYPGANTFKSGRLEELAMHPTVKPVALIADAIRDCSRRGNLVLDPFCGSGTVIIAAERTGRRARAIEFDAGYVDVAVRRWQDYTGKSAVLDGSGELFEDVAQNRCADLQSASSAAMPDGSASFGALPGQVGRQS